MAPASTMNMMALLVLLVAPSAFAWPIKTFDYSKKGTLCDPNKEQYLQVEAYDFHDYPKVTMTWTQVSGPCGTAISADTAKSWTESYDIDDGDAGPDSSGRVQLNIFVCAPFGDYEIELQVASYSKAGSMLQKRTAWEIEKGKEEYHIWDTVNTYLKDDVAYSPKVPGTYKLPLSTAKGFYSKIYAGPLPPITCEGTVPAGIAYEGCFADSSSSRTFKQGMYVLNVRGETGMTTKACSDYCADYDYFGTEFGTECYCGSQAEFNAAKTSTACGMTYESLCYGASDETCGGKSAMSVYTRLDVPTKFGSYVSSGCYADWTTSKIMSKKYTQKPMSVEICFELCNDGTYTHFGTEDGNECYCGTDVNFTKNRPALAESKCSKACSGSTTNEKCGAKTRMSGYTMTGRYLGCFGDSKSSRAMPDNGKYVEKGTMTAAVCLSYCGALGYKYAGTQYYNECWCTDSDSYDKYGTLEEGSCNTPCDGDSSEFCGGTNAMSVYEV